METLSIHFYLISIGVILLVTLILSMRSFKRKTDLLIRSDSFGVEPRAMREEELKQLLEEGTEAEKKIAESILNKKPKYENTGNIKIPNSVQERQYWEHSSLQH